MRLRSNYTGSSSRGPSISVTQRDSTNTVLEVKQATLSVNYSIMSPLTPLAEFESSAIDRDDLTMDCSKMV